MKRREENVEEHLGLFGSLSEQELTAAEHRASRRFHTASVPATTAPAKQIVIRTAWRWRLGLAAAVAAAVLVVIFVQMHGIDTRAMVESADGSRKIEYGEVVQGTEGAGDTVVLSDGSRVEMRAGSELSLERANDGVRIRLNKGDVIVSAAKQHGHLYVQTKDVTVSVIGTVFLVKAEEAGSRVAVIQGEVHVQQGTAERNLQPGEQVSTNPAIESRPVSEELSWSRQAESHLSEWRESAVVLSPLISGQWTAEAQEAFEVASVRPFQLAAGGRGSAELTGCGGLPPQIDPKRFAITANLYSLIAIAYGKGGCLYVAALDLLSGGPDWVRSRSDQFVIQAGMPAGFPSYRPIQVMKGDAPRLQAMLRKLLEDRFNLKLRVEQKEMQVSLLKVGRDKPRLTSSAENDKVYSGSRSQADVNGRPYMKIEGGKASMGDLASSLTFAQLRPVLDRTGITGEFNFVVEYDTNGLVRPTVDRAVKEQLGLELQDTRALVNVWVIEHVEKPSEN